MKIYKDKGFTLIELLIALAISSILILLIGSTYVSYIKLSKREQNVLKIQQDSRSIFYILERDLFQAGYHPNPFDPLANSIEEASVNRIKFRYVTNDETNDFNTYSYYLSGEKLIREEVKSNGDKNTFEIADNVENLQFFYTLSDMTTDFSDSNLTDTNEIIAVSISILVKSGEAIENYRHITDYVPLSNGKTLSNGTVDNTIWVSPNDNYLRRMLTITIYLRNMGLRN